MKRVFRTGLAVSGAHPWRHYVRGSDARGGPLTTTPLSRAMLCVAGSLARRRRSSEGRRGRARGDGAAVGGCGEGDGGWEQETEAGRLVHGGGRRACRSSGSHGCGIWVSGFVHAASQVVPWWPQSTRGCRKHTQRSNTDAQAFGIHRVTPAHGCVSASATGITRSLLCP